MQRCNGRVSREFDEITKKCECPKDMIRKLPVEEVELFLVQAWMIWTQRNVATNGGTVQDPSQLVKRAYVFLDEFRASQEQLAVPNPVEHPRKLLQTKF